MDHDSERYKRDQDLMFQALDERELLRKQAISSERDAEMENKRRAAGVPRSVIAEMMITGKEFGEIMEFLDAEIPRHMVKLLMALRAAEGKPISEERARKIVDRTRAGDFDPV